MFTVCLFRNFLYMTNTFVTDKNMLKCRLYLLIILIQMVCLNAAAQFYGTVLDGQTNEPLPFVTVRYQGTSIGAITDMDGKFEVPITSEHSKLEVSAIGYKTLIVSVNYQRAKQTSTIKLFTDNVMLGNVTVVKKTREVQAQGQPRRGTHAQSHRQQETLCD